MNTIDLARVYLFDALEEPQHKTVRFSPEQIDAIAEIMDDFGQNLLAEVARNPAMQRLLTELQAAADQGNVSL